MATNELPPEYLPPVFDPVITFKDGTVIYGSAGYNRVMDNLWIWPRDEMSFADAVALFSDPEKTGFIRIDHSATEYEEFEGYTELKTITSDYDGNRSIELIKGSE